MQIDDSCMSKTNLWLRQKLKIRGYLSLLEHGSVLWRVQLDLDTLNIAPIICANLVAVHV